MDRTILHVDANSFYASVECAENPAIANKPVAVVGDVEKRRGIVLTANYLAKRRYGVTTGEAVWQAEQKCPGLVIVRARHALYMQYSQRLRDILHSYSDYIEPFGCDEAWVELRGMLQGAGWAVADQIRQRVKKELGITVSVGVSFNKVFAKLGSDMKKPDAITEITRENFRNKVWRLPVEDLLYVGKRTKERLNKRAVYTIGDLAGTEERLLRSWLGKNGSALYSFANGYDNSPVRAYEISREVKSVGNSTTCPRDLINNTEVKTVLIGLSDSVAARLRDKGLRGREITISIRDNELHWISHGCMITTPTSSSGEIAECAMKLFHEAYGWINPIRSLGVRVGHLSDKTCPEQLDLFGEMQRHCKHEALDRAEDALKKRFGRRVVCRARQLCDEQLQFR